MNTFGLAALTVTSMLTPVMVNLNSAYLANILTAFCFPAVWALETAISTAYIE